MIKANIVVVEDEDHICKALKSFLEDDGYSVFIAQNLKKGLVECATRKPDLIVLDLGLPDGDGLDLIREVRAYSNVPIIILSARDSEQSKVNALDSGADDYLIKPFGASELLARIRAQLRRLANMSNDMLNESIIDLPQELRVDLLNHLVYKHNKEIHLTKLEFRLLQVLIKDNNKVLTQRYLMQQVWGANYVEHQHYLRIYIGHLRQKIEDDPTNPEILITEIGIGYRLIKH